MAAAERGSRSGRFGTAGAADSWIPQRFQTERVADGETIHRWGEGKNPSQCRRSVSNLMNLEALRTYSEKSVTDR